ncbi:heme-binding protein [Vibrio sp. DW001]|uniref:GlcG/HbpS family heme-binding protein n=1 Tax=Vibrio sp. DW001 TaxID=2912315 RepID=UPI0023B158E9|nr:heme-binding protein [Vibrio sp. DW001]WED29804.1 heme-binding protein [Vibrio sp. DW001]
MVVTDTSLSWRTAHLIALAAIEYAEARQLKVCVSVLDRHGYPLAQLRINNAAFPCIDISVNKAFTAVSFGFSTQDWTRRLEGNPHLLSSLSQQDRMVLFGGGIPVQFQGETMGAIGVSGASENQDVECANAGIEAFLTLSEHAK